MTTMTLKPGNLYELPPEDLLLERNIRRVEGNADLEALAASITQHGVLEPITAVVNGDGAAVVRFGHRRTIAAVAAGRTTVPVYIAGADDTDTQAEITRVLAQRDENTLRAGLTAAEEVGVVDQLVAFGMSVEEISEQARIAKDRVETARKVSGSKLAKKAAEKYHTLSLEHVAAIAEFEDDTDTVQALTVCAIERPSDFNHALQRRRDDRDRAIKREKTIAEIEASGAKYSKDRPGYGTRVTALHNLLTARDGKAISESDHRSCAGHVGWVDYNGEAAYGCADPKKYGHHDRYSTAKPSKAEMTPAEQEKAKAARRLVIDNNKAWSSAEKVRRNWLATFAKGTKTAPKGAAAFIAIGLTKDRSQLPQYDSAPGELVAHWLGAKKPSGGWDLTPHVEKTTEARALVLALVQVLAHYEATLSPSAWRYDGTTNATGRYLRFLESCGYTLSDVEKYAISKKTA